MIDSPSSGARSVWQTTHRKGDEFAFDWKLVPNLYVEKIGGNIFGAVNSRLIILHNFQNEIDIS